MQVGFAPLSECSLSLFLRVSLSLSLSLLGVSCCPVCGSGLPLAPFKAPAAASQSVSQSAVWLATGTENRGDLRLRFLVLSAQYVGGPEV